MYVEQCFIMIKGKYNYIYRNQSNVYRIVGIYCEDLILRSKASTHFWIHIILVWIWYSKFIKLIFLLSAKSFDLQKLFLPAIR